MRSTLQALAVAGIALLGWAGVSYAEPAAMTCGDRIKVIGALEKGYSEAPVSMGLASNGAMIEVFASQTGSWTMVMTRTDGMTCLVASGSNWEELPKRNVGALI